MKVLRSKILRCCFLLFLLDACPILGLQFDLESEFSYDEESPNGPSQWGEIKPEWSTCSTGKMQSPIDIRRNVWDRNLGTIPRHYNYSLATLVNRGYDMMLQWVGGGGYIHINGTAYQLKQCHWHSPSEHLIDGRRYDLEIHLVHQSQDGRIAVIGMVYEIGPPDPFLSRIEHYIKELADTKDEERIIGYVDPEWIDIQTWRYYRYMGSLTTPPCSENVVWTIVAKVSETYVSREQVELIRRAIHGEPKTNARPVQPLNNRLIKFYDARLRDPLGDINVENVLSSLYKTF